MAFVRLVVGDQSSAEIDQLRRTVNTLLQMLESAEASLAATATAEAILGAWAAAVRTGRDDNPDGALNVQPTNLEIVGLRPMNRHPARPGSVGNLAEMTEDDGAK